MNSYPVDYENLPFEDQLRQFRYDEISKHINLLTTKSILEIGCGSTPFYSHIVYSGKYVFCEASDMYLDKLKKQYGLHQNVQFVLGKFEESILEIKELAETFDVIIIGGFLHEIANPKIVLNALKVFCHSQTRVISYVPNADSFHRLLGIESSEITSKFEFSNNDRKFGRQIVFDRNSFGELFTSHKYEVEKLYSYFIKIFPHDQMVDMLKINGLTPTLLKGFNKMIKYMPNLGCELLIVAKFDSNE
jgi:SAM-dependent methyltransferase